MEGEQLKAKRERSPSHVALTGNKTTKMQITTPKYIYNIGLEQNKIIYTPKTTHHPQNQTHNSHTKTHPHPRQAHRTAEGTRNVATKEHIPVIQCVKK